MFEPIDAFDHSRWSRRGDVTPFSGPVVMGATALFRYLANPGQRPKFAVDQVETGNERITLSLRFAGSIRCNPNFEVRMFTAKQWVRWVAGAAAVGAALPQVSLAATIQTQQAATSVRVSETCPVGIDAVGSTGQSYSVATIEQNLGTVGVYGDSQPDSYSAVKAEWATTGGDPRSDYSGVVVVAFTNDLQRHADALAKLVARPEAIVVCRGRSTNSEMRTILEEIGSKFTGVAGYGARFDIVEVQLFGTQLQVAKELFATYGTKIRIVLGWDTYPDPIKIADCGTVPPTVSPKLIQLKPGTLVRAKAGENFIQFKVQFTTRSQRPVDFFGGVDAVVTKPNSNVIVARTSGLVIALGVSGLVTRKKPYRLEAGAGTDSCDISLGYSLPAGSYEIHYIAGVSTTGTSGQQLVPHPQSLPSIALTIA
jgi:hypothetical protein